MQSLKYITPATKLNNWVFPICTDSIGFLLWASFSTYLTPKNNYLKLFLVIDNFSPLHQISVFQCFCAGDISFAKVGRWKNIFAGLMRQRPSSITGKIETCDNSGDQKHISLLTTRGCRLCLTVFGFRTFPQKVAATNKIRDSFFKSTFSQLLCHMMQWFRPFFNAKYLKYLVKWVVKPD